MWIKNYKKASSFRTKARMTLCLNKIMRARTHAKRPGSRSKRMIIQPWDGLHSLEMLMLLKICGVRSGKGWQIIEMDLEEIWRYGTECRWNGTR